MLALHHDAIADLTHKSLDERIRLGIAEDLVHIRLLRILRQFTGSHPGLKLDIQTGIPGSLLPLLQQGHLDLVVGSLCEGVANSRLLWREPLVWAWASPPGVSLPVPLPLALFPEPCPYRETALKQLAQSGWSQRIVMVCNSNESLRHPVLSGLAIAPMTISQLGYGLTAIPDACGLPPLPDAEYRLFVKEHTRLSSLSALIDTLIETCTTRLNETP